MLPIIGSSPEIIDVLRNIHIAAENDLPVIIHGETGTGKELVAQAIHLEGLRKNEKFCTINSSSIPENLVESELFGHEKGSFTGALKDKVGKFEFADRGTLFFDEIDTMPMSSQAKILRAVETHSFERVGSNESRSTDVRVITATNANLHERVSAKEFREDLFYRLSVLPICIPPLRERKEDIPELTEYLLEDYCQSIGKRTKKITINGMKKLTEYDWPGNVRELQNSLRRAVSLTDKSTITDEHLNFLNNADNHNKKMLSNVHGEFADIVDLLNAGIIVPLKEVELSYIKEALRIHKGNKKQASKSLRLSRSKIYRWI